MWPKKAGNNLIERKPRKERADVLLVYPIWVKQSGRGKLQRMLPPLGILSIASYLEANGFEVHVVDLHAEELTPSQFRTIVRTLKPRLIGITVLSAHFQPANVVARICKEEVPDSRVYAGGVHAEAWPEQLLANPAIDGVGRGDGEELMLELARGVAPGKIAGLSYRESGALRHNPVRETETDLDRYPFPAYHLIDFDLYFPPAGSYRDLPAMNALMTRGCPGKCTFCNSANTTLRSRGVAKTVEMIGWLRSRYGIRQIYFYDDTFTANPKLVREFCEHMIEARIDVRWICYVRGDMFRDELARFMAQAGCHQVLLGVETGSPTLMRAIGKPIDKAKYIEAVRTAHAHGIEVRGSFIIGHQAETIETMRETVEFAIEMDVDLFQLSIMTPYPGTQMYNLAKREGRLLHEDFHRYGQNEVVLRPDHLTPDEIIRFERKAYWLFYTRPTALLRQLRRLANRHQALDLLRAFYVIFCEGIARRSVKNRAELDGWLDYEYSPDVGVPALPKLTYEARRAESSVLQSL